MKKSVKQIIYWTVPIGITIGALLLFNRSNERSLRNTHIGSPRVQVGSLSPAARALAGIPATATQPNELYRRVHGRPLYRKADEILVQYRNPMDGRNVVAQEGTLTNYIQRVRDLSPTLQVVKFDSTAISFDQIKTKIAALPQVASIGANILFNAQSLPNYEEKEWHLRELFKPDQLKADLKRFSTNIVVGVLDTGIDYAHEDLVGNCVPGANLLFNRLPDEPDPTEMDYNGHGTMMAGIIAAMDNEFGVEGVNPYARVCGIKVFNKNSEGYLSDILAGIYWAIAQPIPILNMSFGTYENDPFLAEAIARARAAGLVLIASAGNDYADDVMYPANYPEVIAVGSYGPYGEMSDFSNWGEKVACFAPGDQLFSANLTQYGEERYFCAYGTSASAAFVSGLASVMRSYGQDATQIEQTLRTQVIEQYSPKNPSLRPYKKLNISAICAQLLHEPYEALALTKCDVPSITPLGGKSELKLAIQNVGSAPSHATQTHVKGITSQWEQEVGSAEIPVLAPGQTFTTNLVYPAAALFPASMAAEERQGPLTLQVKLDQGKGIFANRDLLITDRKINQLSLRSLWAQPLDFYDANAERSLEMYIENSGNTVLENLIVKVYSVPALDEFVLKALDQKTSVGVLHTIESIEPGEMQHITIPMPDFTAPKGLGVSFLIDVEKDHAVVKSYVKGYRYPRGKGIATPQHEVNVHRAITDEAIKLIEMQGIYIPDIHAPGSIYRGDPGNNYSQNPINSGWAGKYNGFSENHYDIQGYWSDAVLAYPDLFVTYLTSEAYNPLSQTTLISGSDDCDWVDIAYNYTAEDTFDSHYWFVENNDDDGLDSHFGFVNHHSALYKARCLLYGKNGPYPCGSDGKIVYGAIAHYQAGWKKAAWWFLGQACHLMEDMTLSEHTRGGDFSGAQHGLGGATYEWWMRAEGHHLKWDERDALRQGGIIDATSHASSDPLRFLMYSSAQLGSYFAWSTCEAVFLGIPQEIDGDSNLKNGDEPHYETYMDALPAQVQLPNRPTTRREIARDEVWDSCVGSCQEVEWIGPCEERADCWDHGDGIVDMDNSDGPNDGDGDLTRIGNVNQPYAIRAVASLIYYFAVQTGQIQYDPDHFNYHPSIQYIIDHQSQNDWDKGIPHMDNLPDGKYAIGAHNVLDFKGKTTPLKSSTGAMVEVIPSSEGNMVIQNSGTGGSALIESNPGGKLQFGKP